MYDPTKPEQVTGEIRTMNAPGVPAAAQPVQTTDPNLDPNDVGGDYQDEWNRMRDNERGPRGRMGRDRMARKGVRRDERAAGPLMKRFVPGQQAAAPETPEAMAMRIKRIRQRRLATVAPRV